MYVSSNRRRLELPESLRAKLFVFRRRVWLSKMAEAIGVLTFALLSGFLAVYALDRFIDTAQNVRLAVFIASTATAALIPWTLYRWVWRRRKLDQLARLLSRKHPGIGDQLLGIVELVEDESEQARSITLCEAAVKQVADEAEPLDFRKAGPDPRHRRWATASGLLLAVGAALFALYPAAASNAFARFLAPWRDTPRYTFTQIRPAPETLIVAHGESFPLTIQLTEKSESRPEQAYATIGSQSPIAVDRTDDEYRFEFPPQIDKGELALRIGDYVQKIRVEPTLRPELSSITAEITLPDYLQISEKETRDVRGGAVSLVNGSQAVLTATISRELSGAHIEDRPVSVAGDRIVSPPIAVDGQRKVEFRWEDTLGLAGAEPFNLSINGVEDQPPSLTCSQLPRMKVVLESEQLNFEVSAADDFGVKRVGMVWKGLDDVNHPDPAKGERVLAAGEPSKQVLELTGTFTASSLGIEPQPIHLRLFVEDYFPDRKRVYSPPYLLYVLNAEQHALWLTDQLSRWHRQALDVRDRELVLYETNKQLRELTAQELDDPQTRRDIQKQAAAEQANSRRLSGLVTSGEGLVQQAMRNPEMGVGHLEKWAEMLKTLNDISANRMPSVSDLLRQASEAPALAQAPSESAPAVGQIRNTPQGQGSQSESEEEENKQSPTPQIVDIESSQQPPDPDAKAKEDDPSESGGSRFTLPTTTLIGAGGDDDGEACPAGEKVEQAVEEQKDLLAEFEKVADELNELLANLEGSTLVKRLKAASRLQHRIGGRLADEIENAFGIAEAKDVPDSAELFQELSGQQSASSQDLSNIMDDMQAYFERRGFAQFKAVLDEMRSFDVIGSLRQLSDDLKEENGLSIAQCEFWSDTFDRWAEDLVEPAAGGT